MPSEFETVVTDQTEYGTIITTQGAAIIADCILNGKKLPIVEAAAGDGGGESIVPTPSQITLVNERWRGKIAGTSLNPTTPNMIDVKVVIEDSVGGFTIREMGLYSDTKVLIAVCNTPATEKVSISSGVSGKLTMIMHIVVADVSVLEFSINPSLDMVNRQELEAGLDGHNTDPEAHPHLTEMLGTVEPQEGPAAPTEQTAGTVGQKYTDTSTGAVYTCIAVSLGEDGGTQYTWVAGSLGTLADIRAALHSVSTALGNKADLALISNPNLLDNWYFADPINQRGQTEYTGRGYTIDRWKNDANNTSTILSITPNGLTFSGQLDESAHYFSQWIDRKPDIFYGKMLTGSVLMDGQLYTGTVIVKPQYNVWEGSDFYASGKILFTFQMTSDNLFRFRIIYSQDMITNHSSIAACKLELGSIQTLAHQDTDGNWVLNDPPPNKEQELAKCQRYQLVLPGTFSAYAHVGVGFAENNNTAVIFVPTPVSMRAQPAVSASGKWELRGEGRPNSPIVASNLNWNVLFYSKNMVDLDIKGLSGLTSNRAYSLQASNDPTAKIILDANL